MSSFSDFDVPRDDPVAFLERQKERSIEGRRRVVVSRYLWKMYNLKFSEEEFLKAAEEDRYDVTFDPRLDSIILIRRPFKVWSVALRKMLVYPDD
jgi:hypothetical protein